MFQGRKYMKWNFIFLMTVITTLPLHAKDTKKPCPAKAINEEKAIRDIAKVMTEAEELNYAKELIKNKCLVVANLKTGEPSREGIELLKKRLTDDKKSDSIVRKFCRNLGVDSTDMRRGNMKDIHKDSTALRELRNSIVNACVPAGKSEDEAVKYFGVMIYKFPEETKNIVRSIISHFPEVFSCDDVLSEYKPGHVYLTVFDNELYDLADYLLEKVNSGVMSIHDILNDKDYNDLHQIFCSHFEYKKDKRDARVKKYYEQFFKNKKCN